MIQFSIHKFLYPLKGVTAGVAFLLALSGCTSETKLPDTFTQTKDSVMLFPDYADIVIPPNIAPLNFIVCDATAREFVADIKGDHGHLLAAAGEDGKIEIDSTQWRQLLTGHRGKTLQVDLYGLREKGWVKYRSHFMDVAEEPIDPFLSYRLIEPGYEYYRQLGLYQRNLTNFDEKAIYENNRTYDLDNNHCVNCHNYQAYDASRMLFHVRGNHGGTILARDGKAEKVQIKHDSILTAGVYPSWHPTLPLIVFSTNKTGQVFHMKYPEKIEVLDEASDLLLYDADKNTVETILRGEEELETFPCWAPEGDRLYYCTARRPDMTNVPDSLQTPHILERYDSLQYNILCRSFDAKTHRFGVADTVVNCSAKGKSASVPRISPDGRYLLYTQGDYGQFHIWHRSADLWVKDLKTDSAPYPLKATNSPEADSYHTWSSNGRWIVFASRRGDKNYSRAYIAYFDKEGRGHKAFLLPQQDPELNIVLLKSYNVPELTRNAVVTKKEDLQKVIYDSEGKPIRFLPQGEP
jgi:hypothetical protein